MSDKITKRVVDSLKPGQAVWDGELKGFGVRRRSGEARHYVLKYRLRGSQRWIDIGQHGSPWTVDQARSEAKRLLGEVEACKRDPKRPDPATARDKEKAAASFADFAKRYLTDFAEVHKKAGSVEADRRNLKLHILPAFANKRLAAISRGDVTKFHLGRKDAPANANRCVALISHMYTTAERWGEVPDGFNPARGVEKFKEQARERYLSEAELARLGDALAAIEREGKASPYAVAAIRLLILTGCRLSEILTLEWAHVDFERQCLSLPDSKTGRKTIYLNPPALELLSGLRRIEGNPYVIIGEREGQRLVNLQKPWRRIRTRAGLSDVRLHDLRHSFASMGAGGGLSLPVIGALLGHSQAATTQRYAHLAADPLRQANDMIGQRIAAAMNSGAKAEVVPISASRHPRRP